MLSSLVWGAAFLPRGLDRAELATGSLARLPVTDLLVAAVS